MHIDTNVLANLQHSLYYWEVWDNAHIQPLDQLTRNDPYGKKIYHSLPKLRCPTLQCKSLPTCPGYSIDKHEVNRGLKLTRDGYVELAGE